VRQLRQSRIGTVRTGATCAPGAEGVDRSEKPLQGVARTLGGRQSFTRPPVTRLHNRVNLQVLACQIMS
jgi:hypothetical protein